MLKKILLEIRARHKDLSEILEISVHSVKSLRRNSPKKLDLMLDGVRYRKLIRLLDNYKISKKEKPPKLGD
jgi:DNA-binding CsgD family transcriptional regulator